jgi:hypothetical protein
MKNAGKGTTLDVGKEKHPDPQQAAKEQTGPTPRDARKRSG